MSISEDKSAVIYVSFSDICRITVKITAFEDNRSKSPVINAGRIDNTVPESSLFSSAVETVNSNLVHTSINDTQNQYSDL